MNTPRIITAAVVIASVAVLSACGQSPDSDAGIQGTVTTDGSSTVGPLTKAASIEFAGAQPDVHVTVQITGTGGGFTSFCSGQTDISNASRPISADEMAQCEEAGIEFTEIVVANDGISVVVNPENSWVECLTTEQLHTIWAPDAQDTVTSWAEVDPSFPDEPLALYGPGVDSGTFDYFTEAINGEEGASRDDYEASEDDTVIVGGVKGEPGALGYFGLTYLEENADAVRGLAVDAGDGCVFPSVETVQDGSYSPLSRPLFIYVNNASYAGDPAVQAFVDFYIDNAVEIAETALFVPLTEEQTDLAQDELASLG